jgi:spermidine synthase
MMNSNIQVLLVLKEFDDLHFLFKEFTGTHESTVYDTTELYGEKGKFRVLQFSNDANTLGQLST